MFLLSPRLLIGIAPLLLLGLAYFSVQPLQALSTTWQIVCLQLFPVLSFGLAFLLSLQFNRSRFNFALLFIATSALLQLAPLLPSQLLSLKALIAYISPDNSLLLNLFLMLNMLLFSLFKDRGFFSIHSLFRLAILIMPIGFIFYLPQHNAQKISDFLHQNFIDFSIKDNTLGQIKSTPDLIFISAISCSLLQVLLLFINRCSVQITFIGLQLVLFGLYFTTEAQWLAPLLVTAASLMIIFTIMLDSHDMAYRDELTGLPSRRALNQLQLSLGRKYTIAMLDIDHFKKFNDTHGHDIGDEVLKMVATQIGKVSGGGKAFRYGGEEFTVIFLGKNCDQAEQHCQHLRQKIADYPIRIRQKKRPKKSYKNNKATAKRGKNSNQSQHLSVTISIGIAQRNKTKKTPLQVIKSADEALYRAKKNGRNCVMT